MRFFLKFGDFLRDADCHRTGLPVEAMADDGAVKGGELPHRESSLRIGCILENVI
jgi:hypothetical protein